MKLIKHLRSVPSSKRPGDTHPSSHEMDAFSEVEAEEYAPMDDPELFMDARERRLLAMHRAARARDAKLKSQD